MAEHSKLMSPSASGIWLHCTAQPQALIDFAVPNETSEAAERGTLLHHYSELIESGKHDITKRPPDVEIDEWEMVEEAHRSLTNLLPRERTSVKVWYELGVGFSEEWRKDCFGTCDIVAVDLREKKLHVVDYKYGRGKVSVLWNTQLMIYALATLDTLRQKGLDVDDKINYIEMSIIQPRVNKGAVTFGLSLSDLRKWDDETLAPAQRTIVEGKGKFMVGPWCGEKYCDMRKNNLCPAVVKECANIMEDFINVDTETPYKDVISPDGKLSPEAYHLMRMSKTMKSVIDALWAEATERANAGEPIEGFKLIRGKGSRSWVNEEEADKFLTGKKIKKEDRYPAKFVSVNQAETLLKADDLLSNTRTKNRFEELVNRTEGKLVLAPADDPAPEQFPIDVQSMTDKLFSLNGESEDDTDFDFDLEGVEDDLDFDSELALEDDDDEEILDDLDDLFDEL